MRVRTPLLLCLSLLVPLAGCGHHAASTAANPKAAGPVTFGDFQFTATNGGPNVWGPLQVQVTVTATNTTDKTAILDVLGGNCAVLIRIFSNRARTGKPVYDASQGAECYVKSVHARVAAHETYTAQSGRYGPNIDIAPGHYYLSAYIVPADPEQSKIDVPAGDIVVRR
jgi:hypothetical protein